MSNIAVLVSSCDKYSDLWEPFFTLFFKYWPTCPYPLYLISNHSTYQDSRVTPLRVGDDHGWSTSFKTALPQIPNPEVILMMEEYLLSSRPDTKRIEALAEYMRARNAACLRLYPTPGPDTVCRDNREVGEILEGSAYRLSLQAAIWNRETLISLLREGESSWELELKGTTRMQGLSEPFLSVVRDLPPPLHYFCTAIVKGKWRRDAIEFCRDEGVKVALDTRQVESFGDY